MTKQTLILDSTQIASFLECPRLWNFSYRENLELRPRDGGADQNRPLLMGTYGHKLLEIYYKVKSKEGALKAVDAALAFDPDAICECGHENGEHHKDLESNERFSCNYDECKCEQYKQVEFPLPLADRAAVTKRFREYCYTYANNDFQPHDESTVEVGFSYKLHEDDTKLYVLEGKIDLLGTDASGQQNIIMDHKYQLRTHTLYAKSVQFRNYALATDHRMLIINYIRLTKEVTKDTFQRQIASFTLPELEWWKRQLISVYDRVAAAQSCAATVNNYWLSDFSNPNWASCSGRFGYPCHFTPLCEEPHMAQYKKGSLYQVKKEWRPW